MGSFLLSQPFGDGLAQQQRVRGVAPGAGANFTSALDAQYAYRLVGVLFTLTTSVAVANRYVTIEYLDGDAVSDLADGPTVLQTAGSAQRYVGSIAQTASEWNTGTDVRFGLTPIYLRDGAQFKINVANIQAADTLTLIRFVVDRFLTDESQHAGFEGE